MTLLLGGCCSPGELGPNPTQTVDRSLMDRSLLSGLPCAAPCWYGLKLGVSTSGEATAVVAALPFLNPGVASEGLTSYWDEATQESLAAVLVRFACKQPDQTCATLVFVDGILVQIYLSPSYELSFREVVARLGAPDFVQVMRYHAEAPKFCRIGLIWASRDMTVAFDSADPWPAPGERRVDCSEVEGGLNIDGDLPVQTIFYGLPDDAVFASIPETGRDFAWSGFALR